MGLVEKSSRFCKSDSKIVIDIAEGPLNPVGLSPLAFVLIKTSDVMVELSKFSSRWL